MEPVRNDRREVGLDEWLAGSQQRSGNSSRPSVTLCYAQSLDGSIALRRGERLALSGPESHRLTHQLRAKHDAILVGIGTVISDDPQLNVRLAEGSDPQIVVLDSNLRTPISARLLKGRPHIFCVASASREAQENLEGAGAILERQTDMVETRVSLPVMLARLREIDIRSLMVEGGGEIISSFLSENLIDRVIITIAPEFVGGYKILGQPFEKMLMLKNEKVEKYGKDFILWADVEK